ncbi:MFS-type transporter SLC18B1-like protein, partial [Leptotrombidium deliense]
MQIHVIQEYIGLKPIYILLFLSTCTLSLISPFFPNEALKKGMSPSLTGQVISSSSVSVIIMNVLLGKWLPIIGEKNILIFGTLLNGLSNACFGLVYYANDILLFTILCFVFRIFEGIGFGCINTTAYFLVATNNKKMGLIEASYSLGYIFGYVFGAVLYNAVGFTLSFVLTGMLIVSVIPFLMLSLNAINEVAKTDQVNDEDPCKTNVKSKEKLTFIRTLMIPEMVVILLTIVLNGVNTTLFGPFMQTFLLSKGVHQNYISVAFTAYAVTYASTAILVGRILTKENSINIVIVGTIIQAFAYFLGDTSLIH